MIREAGESASSACLAGWLLCWGREMLFIWFPGALALCTTGLENYTVPLGMGKWITSVTMTIFYVLLYYVWRQRYQIKGENGLTAAVYGLAGIRILLYDAAESMAQRRSTAFRGIYRNLPFCNAGAAGDRVVLS